MAHTITGRRFTPSRKLALAGIGVVAALGVAGGTAFAGTGGMITNGGFEQTPTATPDSSGPSYQNYSQSNAIPGFTITSGNVDLIQNPPYPVHSGANALDLNGLVPGTIEQTVSGLTSGTQYRLTFYLASNTGDDATKTLTVSAFNGSTDTGTLLGTANYTHGATDASFTVSTLDFTASSTSATLQFKSTTEAGPDGHTYAGPVLDDISLAPVTSGSGGGTATPELGSGELFATGLLPIGAVLLYRRRRDRRAAQGRANADA